MPVLGSTADSISGSGVYIPAGALDVWRAARDGGGLAEATLLGDSTLYGQCSGSPDQNYPLTQRLRIRAKAAGYADGGRGLYRLSTNASAGYYASDYLDPASYVDDGGPLVASRTGFTWALGALGIPYAFNSNTPGETVTVNVRTTRCRLAIGEYPGSLGAFTVSINGGAAVTYNASGGTTGNVKYYLLTSADGLTSGTDTLTITVAAGSPGCSVAVEAINSSGVVFHNLGNQGGGFFPNVVEMADPLRASRSQHARLLGLEPPTAGNHMGSSAKSTDPATPRCHAALTMYGINDTNGVYSAATADKPTALNTIQQNVAMFCDVTRAAGCSAIVALPFTSAVGNASTYKEGPNVRAAILSAARSYPEVAIVDLDYAISPRRDLSTYQAPGDAHLKRAGYDMVGDLLWNRVFSR